MKFVRCNVTSCMRSPDPALQASLGLSLCISPLGLCRHGRSRSSPPITGGIGGSLRSHCGGWLRCSFNELPWSTVWIVGANRHELKNNFICSLKLRRGLMSIGNGQRHQKQGSFAWKMRILASQERTRGFVTSSMLSPKSTLN